MNNKIFDDLDRVYESIKVDISASGEKLKVGLVHAFNGTGKTRISRMFSSNQDGKVLCFNAMFQDEFYWEHAITMLAFNPNSWVASFIREQGLENEIENNFQKICDDTLIASLDADAGYIEFDVKTVNGIERNIKISKAEESLFIWSVYYTFIDLMIYELNEKVDDRSTDIFNNIRYIVIDDPVSSVDDIRITNMSLKIMNLLERISEINSQKISVLILTHHALFYNLMYNSVRRSQNMKLKSYILNKKGYSYILTSDKGDTPFAYHLVLASKIKTAINDGNIEKIHFNMFRILLEKTQNYFGYRCLEDCLPKLDYSKEIIKLINLYSHGNLPDFEDSRLTEHEKEIFIKSFNDFMKYYKMEEVNE